MRYFGIGIILIFLMLALISRKNFSKYKEVSGGILAKICCGIAAVILQKFKCQSVKNKISIYLRKLHPLKEEDIEKMTDVYMIKAAAVIPAVVICLGITLVLISFLPKKTGNIVKRNPYGGGETTCQVDITDGENKKVYQINVYPREYEYDEFSRLAENAYSYIDHLLPGENKDLKHLTEDLNFPVWDETGTLAIEWHTDNSAVINNSGKVNNKGLEQNENICITACVKDNVYERNFQWNVVVSASDSALEGADEAAEALKKLEQETRTNEVFIIPDKIGNAEIRLSSENAIETIFKLICMGIIVAGICIYHRYYKLREACLRRNEYLSGQYFRLINKLVLMLGAGMTVRAALQQILEESERDSNGLSSLLNAEIKICLNELDAGKTESKAYSALGNRIGLPEYMRLLSLIGQNVSHGNSNLLNLLEQEEREAMLHKKERARKKGEEASGKLLLPMFVLMITVIGIVLFPVITSL